ncbi:hypothetical protein [Enterococcus gallinarum]|uniref:hypothetical protein n=1 Tax=Enterococcus gallinarum TaxID=1353 RepID=UPI001D17B312|nr:hypothetical protein [Enterococcus gallinarum]MCC4045589.1 hypothetical protein [Enterococcus gallinarum]
MKISQDLYKLMQFRGRVTESKYPCLYGKAASVSGADNERFKKAKEQLDIAKSKDVSIDKIINHTNNFLEEVGIKNLRSLKLDIDKNKIRNKNRTVDIEYSKIQEVYELNNEAHIIWMKFAKEKSDNSGKRYLGVVAASNDINFSAYYASGIIIESLNLEWDETFVLVFPLPGITDGMRKDIECGVGNYLISKDIPILDFYSHRFQ